MNSSLLKCWGIAMVMALIASASAKAQLVITTKSLPVGTSGIPYSAVLNAIGGSEPYAWSVTRGSLPSGLKLDSTTGAISGTPSPSNATPNGSKLSTFLPFPLIFQVQDSDGHAATANLPIKVANPIAIQTTSLPEGVVGKPYSFCLTAGGGVLAYNGGLWSVAGGKLPARIILTENSGCRGLLSGTPSKAGKFSVLVRVTDFQGRSAQESFVLTIAKKLRSH